MGKINAREGKRYEIVDDNSHLTYEIVESTKIVYLHDLFIDTKDRRQGKASNMINQLIDDVQGYDIWVAIVSEGMERLAEKLEFMKIADKNLLNPLIPIKDIPSGVSVYSNAVIYRKKYDVRQ